MPRILLMCAALVSFPGCERACPEIEAVLASGYAHAQKLNALELEVAYQCLAAAKNVEALVSEGVRAGEIRLLDAETERDACKLRALALANHQHDISDTLKASRKGRWDRAREVASSFDADRLAGEEPTAAEARRAVLESVNEARSACP